MKKLALSFAGLACLVSASLATVEPAAAYQTYSERIGPHGTTYVHTSHRGRYGFSRTIHTGPRGRHGCVDTTRSVRRYGVLRRTTVRRCF